MKVQVFDEIKREENKQLIADMEKWEIKFSRDCCEFSYEQIMMYLKGKHSSSMFSLSKYVSFFKGYTDLCIANHLSSTNINMWGTVSKEDIKQCINVHKFNQKKITKPIVLEMCHIISNPCDSFVAIASYEGFKLDEIMELRKSDFNFERNTIRKSDVEFEYPEEMIHYALLSFESYVYDTGSTQLTLRDIDEGDPLLLKSRKDQEEPLKKKAVMSRYYRQLQRLDSKYARCSPKNLYISGFIHALEQNKDGLPVDVFIDLKNENYYEVLNRYGRKSEESFTIRQLYYKITGGK